MIRQPDREMLIHSMKTMAEGGPPDLSSLAQGRPATPPLKRKPGDRKRHSDIMFVNSAYDSRKTGIDGPDHLPSAYRIYIGAEFFSFTCGQLKSLMHGHFAIQLAFNFEAPFRLSVDHSEETELFFFIIPPHVPHQLVSSAGKHLSILIDPLSVRGRKLNALFEDQDRFLRFSRGVLDRIYPHLFTGLPEFETVAFLDKANALLDHMMSGLPEYRMDERILSAISQVKKKGGRGIGTGDLAGWTSLSNSRARHLFKEETGVPFTQYLKWLKVMEAIKYTCTSGGSLTKTAHMAGFSDSAHLSRTFREMFGLAPSSILQ